MAIEVYRPQPRAILPIPEPIAPPTMRERISKFLQPRTSPARVPDIVTNVGNFMMVSQNTALTRPAGASTYRAYAQTPWVFSAINIRKNQIASAEWDIVPFDNEKRFPAKVRDELRDLFTQPSLKIDSFQSFAATVIDDILTLDAGVCEKVRYPDGRIAELWPVRGEWIAVDERWDGSDPDKARYYFVPDGTVRAAFRNDDMVYMIANQRANSAVGVSPMQVLQTVIESEIQALEYNRRQVMGAAPDGVLNIGESAAPEDVQKAQSKFQAEIFGQGAMAVIGGYKSPSFLRFRDSNRDMQFREWEDLLIRCIATVLGMSPMDLGITFDVNRSTAEQQGSNTEDRGLKPLMSLFQNYMTREVVWDKAYGGKANNLAFKFSDLTLDESLAKANINKIAMPGVPTKSVNEARRDAGRAPIGDPQDDANIFNHLLTNTPKGMLDITANAYLGEEQLAQIATQSKIDLAQAVADANPQQEPVQTAKEATFDDLLQKAIGPFIDRQDQMLGAIQAIANRAIEVNVASAPTPNVEVHPTNVEVAPAKVEFMPGSITTPEVHIAPANVEVHASPITVEPAIVKIEKGAIHVEPSPVQVDVHVPQMKQADVVVNTPAEIAITKMPTRATKRVVTKRNTDGAASEVQDVETDIPS